jgi:hypothetical protein
MGQGCPCRVAGRSLRASCQSCPARDLPAPKAPSGNWGTVPGLPPGACGWHDSSGSDRPAQKPPAEAGGQSPGFRPGLVDGTIVRARIGLSQSPQRKLGDSPRASARGLWMARLFGLGSACPKSPQRKLGDSTFPNGQRAIQIGIAQRPGVPGLPPGACGWHDCSGSDRPAQKPPAEAGGQCPGLPESLRLRWAARWAATGCRAPARGPGRRACR